MKRAETVTFGGSGLDRAAKIRESEEHLRQCWEKPDTGVLPIWRGKPLFSDDKAAFVSVSSPVVALAGEAPVFLGLDEGAARFAVDISAWEPLSGEAQQTDVFFDSSAQTHPDLPEDHQFLELRGVMAKLTPRDAELVATAKAILNWHRSHRFCAACGQPSEVAMGGWQRTCPACAAAHFPRTDPVVIMLITHGNDVLLGRSPGWPDGMYSLLAGFVEPGETIEGAVRREVLEESNIRVGAVEYLSSQPWPFPNSLMFGCRGEALNRDITPDPDEIEDARWVSREELARAFAGEHPDLLPARKGAIAQFLLSLWLADKLD